MANKPVSPETPALLAGVRFDAATPSAGQVVVRARWSATRRALVDLSVASDRPSAARLLVGKTPAEALRLVPLLFSLCGRAQLAVAQAAMSAAGQGEETTGDGEPVRREMIQEHLWRLMLDWPEYLKKSPERAAFAHWHRRLKDADGLDATVREELQSLVDGPLAASVEAWAGELETSVAPESSAAGPDFLPAVSTSLLADVFANADADFARQPIWRGRPAETGALARQWNGDASLAGRLRARWRDLQQTVMTLAGPAMPVIGLAVGETTGVAGVDTARGLLVHRVRLHAGRVADYQVIAPTEWNFHPQQAWREQLGQSAAESPEIADDLIRRWVLALDPCVPNKIILDKED